MDERALAAADALHVAVLAVRLLWLHLEVLEHELLGPGEVRLGLPRLFVDARIKFEVPKYLELTDGEGATGVRIRLNDNAHVQDLLHGVLLILPLGFIVRRLPLRAQVVAQPLLKRRLETGRVQPKSLKCRSQLWHRHLAGVNLCEARKRRRGCRASGGGCGGRRGIRCGGRRPRFPLHPAAGIVLRRRAEVCARVGQVVGRGGERVLPCDLLPWPAIKAAYRPVPSQRQARAALVKRVVQVDVHLVLLSVIVLMHERRHARVWQPATKLVKLRFGELQPEGLPQHQLIHYRDILIAVGDHRLVLVLVVVVALLELVPVNAAGLWGAGRVSLRRARVARAPIHVHTVCIYHMCWFEGKV